MRNREVAYYDSDERYARKLSGYLCKRKGLPFRMRTFTDEDSFADYIQREQPAYLLVPEKDLAQVPQNYGGEQILFTEEEERASPKTAIFKYQAGDQITKQLMSFYYRGKKEHVYFDLAHRRVIGIFSPVRRCGKSRFAAALAQSYAEKDPTLLVCIDDCLAFPEEVTRINGRGLSDLIFCYLELPDKLPEEVPLIARRWGRFDLIAPTEKAEDLYLISADDWLDFIRMTAVSAGYRTVILDLGLPVKGFDDLLEMCDIVYMPILEDAVSKEKIRRLRERLKEQGQIDLEERLIALELPEEEEQTGGYFETIANGEMGNFVRRLREGAQEQAD